MSTTIVHTQTETETVPIPGCRGERALRPRLGDSSPVWAKSFPSHHRPQSDHKPRYRTIHDSAGPSYTSSTFSPTPQKAVRSVRRKQVTISLAVINETEGPYPPEPASVCDQRPSTPERPGIRAKSKPKTPPRPPPWLSKMSASGKSSASSGSGSKRPIDPITRTALRYTISPREYELLHQYLISRAPKQVQKRTPNPPRYEKITESRTEAGDYNASAMRAALRVFVLAFAGLKGYEGLKKTLAARKAVPAPTAVVASPPSAVAHRNPNARVALAFSSLLLFHRLLFRFFKKLRVSLLEENAEPFRKRNPGITKLLTSKYTPALGASLAGFLLSASPSDQLRMTIVIYVLSRSLEFGYNALAEGGYLWDEKEGRPWWFGSWLIMPFACGQLLHAFVFDRDCFPESYGKFILARSPEYIQLRPKGWPADKPWPNTFDIVDALAAISKLKWPAFVSPILFPNLKDTLPSNAAVQKVSPILSPAFPGAKNMSCALLHPHDPSCARTYLKYWIAAFPSVAKFFTLVYGAFALLAYKSLLKAPVPFLNKLSARILRMTVFITGSIGTSWASICLFNNIFPRSFLPTQRWFLGGFLGGMWAFVANQGERSTFLYSLRTTIESTYQVGKKHGWWKGVKNGDVLVFVASLALINYVHEARPTSVNSGLIRKVLSSMNGEGWVDRAAPKKAVEEDKSEKQE